MAIHGAQDCIFWFHYKWCPSLEFAKKHLKPSGNLQKQKKELFFSSMLVGVARLWVQKSHPERRRSQGGACANKIKQTRDGKQEKLSHNITQSSLQILESLEGLLNLLYYVVCSVQNSPARPRVHKNTSKNIRRLSPRVNRAGSWARLHNAKS